MLRHGRPYYDRNRNRARDFTLSAFTIIGLVLLTPLTMVGFIVFATLKIAELAVTCRPQKVKIAVKN